MKRIAAVIVTLLLLLSGCGLSEPVDSGNDGDARGALTLESLNETGIKIGVATGSKADNVVRAEFGDAEVLQYATVGEGFVAVKTGKIDAFCYDRAVMLHTVAENPDLTLMNDVIAQNDLVVGIRDGLGDLEEDVNAAIRKLTDDGTIDEMKVRWLEGDPEPAMPEILSAVGPDRTLVIGTSHENRPMCYLDADGNPTGFDVEFARRLASQLGFAIEFRVMDWPALIPSLKSNKIDMIIATLNSTEERKQNMVLTDPYVYADIVMMVRRQEGSYYRADDFIGKRIGVVTGSVYDSLIDEIAGTHKYYFDRIFETAEAVKSGKTDATINAESAMRRLTASYPELTILYPAVAEVPFGAMFHKDNEGLRAEFNKFFLELKEDPIYEDMVSRWLDTENPPPLPDIPSSGANGVLTLATTAEDEPFSYMQDGALAGFDIELAYRFAAYMEMELEIVTMSFYALFPSIQSGRSDFACAMITITDERAQTYGFSDPYYTDNAVMIVRAEQSSAGTPSFWEGVKKSFYQNLIVENRWRLVTDGLRVTMIISVSAMLFGTLLGFLICFMMLSKLKILNIAAKIYTALLRGTPIVVLLMIIFYIIFAKVNISPVLVAVIAFGLNAGAFVGGLAHTAILTVDKGQIEAARSIGFGSVGAFLLVTLPQAMKVAMPVYKAEFVSLVKATAVVGYIAIMDLTKAGDIIRSRTYDAFFPLLAVAAVYFIITGACILLFGRIEKLTDKRGRRKKI